MSTPAEKACPPGKEPYKVDEDLIFYQNWELEACVDGTMLARQMDLVNEIPFTYEQLSIFKHKLDKVIPFFVVCLSRQGFSV